MTDRSLPIAVIVPVYNDERYLGDCLASLRDQSRPPAEIILVDNGSTDRSVEIAEAFGLSNLRIIRNHENIGATAARNLALDATAQPFATFVDSDDFLSDEALELAHQAFADSQCDISLFRVAKTAPDGAKILFEIETPKKPLTGLEALAMTLPTWRLQTLGIYRRTVLDKARAKFSYHGFSDDEFFARLFLAEATRVTGSAGTYFYRTNPKRYSFAKVAGQTRTNIRSARLAEERLGTDYAGGGAARNMISRNLAGLAARAVRGEGSFREVAALAAEARALRSKRLLRDSHWRLFDAAVSAVAHLSWRRAGEARTASHRAG